MNSFGQPKSEEPERSDNSLRTPLFFIRKMFEAGTKLYGRNGFWGLAIFDA
jgi:hypothetical protein